MEFQNVIEDPSIETIKNIEIFLIEVKHQVCDEKKVVEEFTLETNPINREIIPCEKPTKYSLECREDKSFSHESKPEEMREGRYEENYSIPVKRRTGPILNSVQLILNAGTLYNMNY